MSDFMQSLPSPLSREYDSTSALRAAMAHPRSLSGIMADVVRQLKDFVERRLSKAERTSLDDACSL